MSRRRQLIIGLFALLLALASGYAAYTFSSQLMVTTEVTVPAVPIPPYTVITPDLLTTKAFPRPLLDEPVFHSARELLGRIATVRLEPGMLIYHAFAVSQSEFRLVGDPSLEVVSFPVDPAKAVGGQVQAGHRIHVYRAISQGLPEGARDMTPQDLLALDLAAVEVLAEDVLVVDVRNSQGQPVQIPETDQEGTMPGSRSQNVPLQIVTVAASHQEAAEIVRLVAEGRAQVALWVSLSPLTGPCEGVTCSGAAKLDQGPGMEASVDGD